LNEYVNISISKSIYEKLLQIAKENNMTIENLFECIADSFNINPEDIATEIAKHLESVHGKGEITKPLRFPGGDWYIKDEILELITKSNCNRLVEVFGGSGVISMYAPRNLFKQIIYNDKDELIFNFFKVLKEKPKELFVNFLLTPISKTLFEKYVFLRKSGEIHKLDDIEKAIALFYLTRLSVSINFRSFFKNIKNLEGGGYILSFRRQILNIMEYAKMWSDIVLENRDFREIIQRYDSVDTVFYCDPPYLESEETYGKWYFLRFQHSDMVELLRLLSNIKGKFVLKLPESHMEFLYIKDWVNKNNYNVKDVLHHRYISVTKEEELPIQKTVLIYNYQIQQDTTFKLAKWL
jgi:DNA adenine methylase